MDNAIPVTIEEIVDACRGHPDGWRKRAVREAWPRPDGWYSFALEALPEDIREKILAHRERRHRTEQTEAVENCAAVERPIRNELSLSESQRAIGLARAHLVLWIDDLKAARGLNDHQAIVRAVIHAEEDRDCNFRALLNKGQRRGCAIKYWNLVEWRSLWNRYRRHHRDWHNWHVLAPLDRGPAALLSPADRDGDARFWHHIALLYEHRNGLDLIDAWAQAKRTGEAQGWGDCPSYGQVAFWYREKTDRAAVQARRKGERFIYNVLDTPARCDWSNLPPGSMWFADHHLCNDFVRVPKRSAPGFWYAIRPTLTLFLDVPSMHVVGYIIRAEKGDGDVILTAWQRAVMATGFCAATVTFDNGKDYASIGGKRGRSFSPLDVDRVSTTGAILGVRVSFKLPHNPRSSPCEMWFAHMAKFEKSWPTFSGENAERLGQIWPALSRQKLATHGGSEDDPARGCLVNPELVPTLEEYIVEFDHWLREERERKVSDGIMLDGKSPDQAWREGLRIHAGKPVDDRTRFVAFLRAFSKPQRVGKGCIVLFKRSESQRSWIRYHSRALEPFLLSGEEVLVKINTEDVSVAYVSQWIEGDGWKLIDCGGPNGGCPSIADIPRNTGTEQVREITRANRARRKAIREGLNAQEQEAAFDALRRSGFVRPDASNAEIALEAGSTRLAAQTAVNATESKENTGVRERLRKKFTDEERLKYQMGEII